jgi:esterase/lipase
MSNLEGKKPKTFLDFAKKNRLGFLALEYSGHGKSSGKFINGNISKWTKETSQLIKKIVKKNKIILVGSSMGAWISLNQFKFFKEQIIGFLGIGSAPEFLEGLMWKKFSKKMKKEIKKNGIINLKHGDYEYPISLQLIKDGKKNKVLNKKIYQKLNVTMVHGDKDKSVPVSYSRKVLKIFKKSKKKLVIVKNGDHSLSSSKWLKILKKELKLIVS